jgi:hypothetical protein
MDEPHHRWGGVVMARTTEAQGDRVRQILDRFQADLRADSLRHW